MRLDYRSAGSCLLLLLLCLGPAGAAAQPAPTLRLFAPPELDASRRRLEAFETRSLADLVQAVGLETPGGGIDVVLAGEDSEAARSVGRDIAGYAISRAGLVVLFPSRSPRYPHDTLEDVLRHEVAHVLIGRAAGGRDVPRWFHEGLAVAVERPWDLEDRSRLVWELIAGPRLSIRDIDASFERDGTARRRAYSLSAAVVRDVIAHYGAAAPADVLRQVREGVPFEAAIEVVTGRPLNAVVDAFWDRQRVWTVWVPLLTSGNVLWLMVILVGVLAVWRRRRRSAEIRRRWDEADATPSDEEPRS